MKSAFKKCGVWPVNRQEIPDSALTPAARSDGKMPVAERVQQLLRQVRRRRARARAAADATAQPAARPHMLKLREEMCVCVCAGFAAHSDMLPQSRILHVISNFPHLTLPDRS